MILQNTPSKAKSLMKWQMELFSTKILLSFHSQFCHSFRLERRLKLSLLITQKILPIVIVFFMVVFWLLGILNLVLSNSNGPDHTC